MEAKIKLPDGTTIDIQGKEKDVRAILLALKTTTPLVPATSPKLETVSHPSATMKTGSGNTVRSRIEAIKGRGFFSQGRSISDIRDELKKMGHTYPITHLSGPLLRMVQLGVLRRLEGPKGWHYVNP